MTGIKSLLPQNRLLSREIIQDYSRNIRRGEDGLFVYEGSGAPHKKRGR